MGYFILFLLCGAIIGVALVVRRVVAGLTGVAGSLTSGGQESVL